MKIQEIMNKIVKEQKSMFLTEREVDRFIPEEIQEKIERIKATQAINTDVAIKRILNGGV